MTQEACDAYFFDFKPNGLLLVDSTFVTQIPSNRAIAIPFTRIARDEIGREMTANMVALGAIATFCPLVKEKSMEAALLARAPEGSKELNLKAFKAGVKAAKKIDLAKLPRSIVAEDEEEI
jgi:2-oxoglutarate ferredoxin oxidoreductase subunit gamma